MVDDQRRFFSSLSDSLASKNPYVVGFAPINAETDRRFFFFFSLFFSCTKIEETTQSDLSLLLLHETPCTDKFAALKEVPTKHKFHAMTETYLLNFICYSICNCSQPARETLRCFPWIIAVPFVHSSCGCLVAARKDPHEVEVELQADKIWFVCSTFLPPHPHPPSPPPSDNYHIDRSLSCSQVDHHHYHQHSNISIGCSTTLCLCRPPSFLSD